MGHKFNPPILLRHFCNKTHIMEQNLVWKIKFCFLNPLTKKKIKEILKKLENTINKIQTISERHDVDRYFI